MIAIRNGRVPHWALWSVVATVSLTGLWFSLGALGKTAGPEPNGFGIWIVVAVAWIVFLASMAGWSLVSSDGSVRRRLSRAGAVLLMNWAALAIAGLFIGLVEMGNRLCTPGSDANAPSSLAWLAPALVYYSIGYYGFSRPRRLWLIWPLAIVCALVTLLIVELIWTTGSGCGD